MLKLFLTSLDFLPFSISILLHSVVAGESALSWSPLSWTPSSQVAVPPVPHIEPHSRGEREFPFPVIPGNTSLKFPFPSRGIL